eukprot:CAMPEP_0181227738 /NCGR_PEP_ID=MMETSP1096-20121128/32954_1 /TAXON_ID=156174 ORGANISM="Chrysochromulina ericina, Strain CCMP281" /NCGR_SAMPLE_ID=MMETSP1096 /ASSEMBLY_ACC=CAM_ASM_000453 /LENGTH=51 /DNA_ID=CAMNT_0023321175 /DNA_START=166 /DNA_END=321 /DNA_ORIENTATION=+
MSLRLSGYCRRHVRRAAIIALYATLPPPAQAVCYQQMQVNIGTSSIRSGGS